MVWNDVVAAADELGWPAYLGTADTSGRPHVSVVAPGMTDATVWVATRRGTRKLANIAANPHVFLHWSVGGEGPGELFIRGTAAIHDGEHERRRLWTEANLPYDPDAFFGGPDNDDVVFVRIDVTVARLLGPDGARMTWSPRPV